jgi:hypothetical protein
MERDGEQYRQALPSFAEPILCEDRWDIVIYVGLMERSNKVKVVVNSTVFKVNCIRRLSEAQRKDPVLVNAVTCSPWTFGTSGSLTTPVVVGRAEAPLVPEEELREDIRRPRGAEVLPRQIEIRRGAELLLYGYLEGCPGCDAAQSNSEPRAHSIGCRERIENETLKHDAERRILRGEGEPSVATGEGVRRAQETDAVNGSASSAAAPPDNLTTEATELEAPLSEKVGPEGSEVCAVPLTKKPRVDIGAIENLGEASVRTLTKNAYTTLAASLTWILQKSSAKVFSRHRRGASVYPQDWRST